MILRPEERNLKLSTVTCVSQVCLKKYMVERSEWERGRLPALSASVILKFRMKCKMGFLLNLYTVLLKIYIYCFEIRISPQSLNGKLWGILL